MNPARLRQARLAAGRTLRKLSDFLASRGLQLSHAALRKHEAGVSRAAPRALFWFAEALGTRPQSFLRESPIEIEWLACRRHAALTQTAPHQITATATRRVEDRVEIERRLGEPFSDGLPRPRSARSMEQVETLAEHVRAVWMLGQGPIASMTRALEAHGAVLVEVAPPRRGFDGLCGRAQGRRAVIVVSDQVPPDWRRYTLAHELGRLVMPGSSSRPREQEALAHRFAGACLVPAVAARRELGERSRHLSPAEPLPLKARYGMSVQAWIRRALDLGIITPAHHASRCREVGRLRWRRVEPGDCSVDERPARQPQMLMRGLAEKLVTPDEAERIQPGVSGAMGVPGHTARSARSLLARSAERRQHGLERGAAMLARDDVPGGALRGFDAEQARDMSDDADDD